LKPLGDYALGSSILDPKYKESFNELATESFIRALDARISRRPALADQAAREGFVLTPVFMDGLDRYEAQEREMRLYFPEMLDTVDLKASAAKLDQIELAEERTVRAVRVTVPAKPPELTGLAKTFEDAENLLRDRKVEEAKALFDKVLVESAEPAMKAKATYGLARVAILNRDPETGERLLREVLEMQPDAHDKSWTLLYLGKLWDSQGETDTASGYYRQALTVEGLPDQVRREAEQGVQGAFRREAARQ
jgi:tetratricopeptide (TPR) repeat protein